MKLCMVTAQGQFFLRYNKTIKKKNCDGVIAHTIVSVKSLLDGSGWKQKFLNIFFTNLFVDNKTAQKLDGNFEVLIRNVFWAPNQPIRMISEQSFTNILCR